ncbi:formate/nitrite transporter [Haloterrigena turkmenica DSM 5511]|uniref:Formate/nitrite transporter n=1 Tax=Haloterrigena turkmenica (strain ATCC 51198 / DSM 5511 / JCM 9101 / NCIMB 13204 / VKM B-1734 / 4k) TaxID=543526 RepID=D2RRB1_HALTV|nr:formate/nitrite transporter [Haloterrigena turkmenica DSM 5511]
MLWGPLSRPLTADGSTERPHVSSVLGGDSVSDGSPESKADSNVDSGSEQIPEGSIVTEQTPTPEVLESLIDSGLHEIYRETTGLVLSGFSAGLDIGFGPLLMAVMLTLSTGGYGDLQTELLLASAYSVGFIFVIIGRSELFTEHTTVAVMPVLDGRASVRGLGRLWGLVYASNVVGSAVFTVLVVTLMPNLGVASPAAFVTIAHKLVDHGLGWLFVAGIFAGWLMGLLAWLVTAAQETLSRVLIVWMVTASIGILHLPHSIVGNVEVLFGLALSPSVTLADYVAFLALSTLGNAVGGGVFVGLLKYSHVVRGAG